MVCEVEAMAQQTEQRAVIGDRKFVGFVVPGQYITIYRADEEFKPLADGLEAVWIFRSETIRWGPNPTLDEGEIRRYFVNRDVEAAAVQPGAPSRVHPRAARVKELFRDFTVPPMSIASLVLAAFMLGAGVLLLIDAPALGPLLGGLVFGGAIFLLLFAIFGPFMW
jgi:hypothetical protein